MPGIENAPAADGRRAKSTKNRFQLTDTSVLEHCFSRICSWRVPPNWSTREWCEEIKACAVAAACRAVSEYDPARGVPIDAFIYQRVMARVLTRHRQEWGYALRVVCENREEMGDNPDGLSSIERLNDSARSNDQNAAYEDLREAIESLSESNRWLVTQLFWNGQTEVDIAHALGIGRRAVNKRKHAALQSLHEILAASERASGLSGHVRAAIRGTVS